MRKLILAALLALSAVPAFGQAPPPVPALPDAERRTSYSISSSTCACAVNFALYGDAADYGSWLEVFVNGVLLPSANWTIISPTGPLATIPRPITDAVLTFNTPQTGTVQIVGARRPRRSILFAENRGVPARDLNQGFNDIYSMLREDWDKINDVTGRAVLAPPGETLALLPSKATRASQAACFDINGNLINCAVTVVPSGSFVAGSGVTFAGSNPTTVSIGTKDALFASGRPWFDVQAFGAVGDGSTDDTVAIQNAINAAAVLTTGIVYFPPPHGGAYCIKTNSALTVTGSLWLLGSGQNGSVVSMCGTVLSSPLLTLSGGSTVVQNMQFLGYGSQPSDVSPNPVTTNQYVIKMTNCTDCLLDHVYVTGGLGTFIQNAGDWVLRDFGVISSYGSAQLLIRGTGGSLGSGWLERVKLDQGCPTVQAVGGTTAAPSNWAATTAYSTNQIVFFPASQTYMQARVGGTSGSSQPSPTNYLVDVTDGTVKWRLAMPQSQFYGMQLDSGTEQVAGFHMDMSGCYTYGLGLTNVLATNGPILVTVTSSTFAGLFGGANASAGQDLRIEASQFPGCMFTGCNLVISNGGWIGSLSLVGNIMYQGYNGVDLAAGTSAVISSNTIYGNANDAVLVAAGISHWLVTGNELGSAGGFFGNNNASGVIVTTGASDYYNITNNICHPTPTCVTDGGSGTHKTISGNN
jgi:hypothetical protein